MIVGGVETMTSLPMMHQLLPPPRHVFLHSSGRHWGASVCGGLPTVGGPRHITTSAPGYTYGSHPHCRGQHVPSGNHHMSGLCGDCLHHRAHLHSRRCAATLPITQGMQGPSPGPSHLPTPPSAHQCVCYGAIRQPTSPTSPGIATL